MKKVRVTCKIIDWILPPDEFISIKINFSYHVYRTFLGTFYLHVFQCILDLHNLVNLLKTNLFHSHVWSFSQSRDTVNDKDTRFHMFQFHEPRNSFITFASNTFSTIKSAIVFKIEWSSGTLVPSWSAI